MTRLSLDHIVKWDKDMSRRLAVCSSADSSWGYLRPFMRLLEYSGHGVLWFVGVAVLLLMSHQIDMQQKLLNLFSCEYDIYCTYFLTLYNARCYYCGTFSHPTHGLY